MCMGVGGSHPLIDEFSFSTTHGSEYYIRYTSPPITCIWKLHNKKRDDTMTEREGERDKALSFCNLCSHHQPFI